MLCKFDLAFILTMFFKGVNSFLTFTVNGRLQKISVPYHGQHFGIPREGKGGFNLLDWKSEGIGG